MAFSSLSADREVAEVLREWPRLLPVVGINWLELPWAMNSQDGAVCGFIGEANDLLPESCWAIEVYCNGALVGGMSDDGDDA
jgi:hypothetical protein